MRVTTSDPHPSRSEMEVGNRDPVSVNTKAKVAARRSAAPVMDLLTAITPAALQGTFPRRFNTTMAAGAPNAAPGVIHEKTRYATVVSMQQRQEREYPIA
jgi:hypothetical protein